MRVYDLEQKKWIMDGIYLNPNTEELYIFEKKRFRKERLVPVSSKRFIVHNDIRLTDKDGYLIHEGDIVEAEINPNEFIMTMIGWLPERAAYSLLDFATETFYPLGEEQCKHVKIVGNVFNTPNAIKFEKEEPVGKVSKDEAKTDGKVSEKTEKEVAEDN